MSVTTILFLVIFIAMIVMLLRGHAGHGGCGSHGQRHGAGDMDDARQRDHAHG